MVDIDKSEEFFAETVDDSDNKIYNFMINASNQANLTSNNNISPTQLSSIFIVISPYYIEKLNIEGLDLDIKVSENNTVTINNIDYEMVEINPGVKIFGLCKHNKE
ncbi:hypothetical protein [Tepidimicrobium xylanilyticum]|uniref:Uncharacterized protein n=1 Tax=Tepidimicrobium xylanilyticum TaxID=1123352 RepID=A0A1H2ZHZ1_9FIRM|nr:hypothetical protein [Tepidimicrobium xylanilyticum]GMG96477.1 hypothetical protein EN5CB1_13030 [Tepidimicrobium xylanilyticum]SDX16384.1 hypothetical protein SAMN05660923_01829 [Tepidimicrobium xylanilyticum]